MAVHPDCRQIFDQQWPRHAAFFKNKKTTFSVKIFAACGVWTQYFSSYILCHLPSTAKNMPGNRTNFEIFSFCRPGLAANLSPETSLIVSEFYTFCARSSCNALFFGRILAPLFSLSI